MLAKSGVDTRALQADLGHRNKSTLIHGNLASDVEQSTAGLKR
jgi:hypothetical protein